jgi:RNA polymerase-binding transcription factor DksA
MGKGSKFVTSRPAYRNGENAPENSPGAVPASSMAEKNRRQTPTRRRAVTEDIVGNQAPVIQRVPHKWKKHYRHLIELRNYLLTCQDELATDAKEKQTAFSLHMADAATDSFDRDLALSRISSEQDAVYEIDEALDRIRDGAYGFCELTGKPIEAARLEAIPWTRFSREAEATLEKNGTIRRPRLAPREPVPRGVSGEREGQGSTEAEQSDQE